MYVLSLPHGATLPWRTARGWALLRGCAALAVQDGASLTFATNLVTR